MYICIYVSQEGQDQRAHKSAHFKLYRARGTATRADPRVVPVSFENRGISESIILRGETAWSRYLQSANLSSRAQRARVTKSPLANENKLRAILS